MSSPTLEAIFENFLVLPGKPPLEQLEYWWTQERQKLSALAATPGELGTALEELSSQLLWQGLVAEEFRLMRSYDDITPQVRVWERVFQHLSLADEHGFVQECAAALPASRLYRYLAAQSCMRLGQGQLALDWITQALALDNVCTGSQNLLEEIVNRFPQVEDRYRLRGLKEYLKDKVCPAPSSALSSGWGGRAFLCQCPSWLPFPSGNVLEAEGADSIWNSDVAQELRKSVTDARPALAPPSFRWF